jgi:hypothetical protein
MRDTDETIVYLMRSFHWTFEYARDLATSMPVRKLNKLLAETRLQQQKERYSDAANFAMICAVLVNLQSKDKRSIEDFIGQPPGHVRPKREIVTELVRTQLHLRIPK